MNKNSEYNLIPGNPRKIKAKKDFGYWLISVLILSLSSVANIYVLGIPVLITFEFVIVVFIISSWFFLFNGKKINPVIVLNFHSVAPSANWLEIGSMLSISPKFLEQQIIWLLKNKYEFLFCKEYEEIQRNDKRNNNNICVLTFDDGYLDNWVYLMPILKKYQVKATIFVATSFIEPGLECRPQYESNELLEVPGYLNAKEIYALSVSGLVEIGSHSHCHARVYKNNVVLRPNTSERPNHWLLCEHTEGKQYQWYKKTVLVPNGIPLFEQTPGLLSPGFIPDFDAVQNSIDHYNQYNDDVAWKKSLPTLFPGEMETLIGYKTRVFNELNKSKEILEVITKNPIVSFCWPENAFNSELLLSAKKAGYKTTCSNHFPIMNIPGDPAWAMGRVFIGTYNLKFIPKIWDWLGFRLNIKIANGQSFYYPLNIALSFLKKRQNNGSQSKMTSFELRVCS